MSELDVDGHGTMNPFSRVMHSWNCARYDGVDVPCTCFTIQCVRCRGPQRSDRRPCWCLAAEILEEATRADLEAFYEDERRMMQEIPTADDDHMADVHYNYWVNREVEREQQLSDKSRGRE